MASQIVLLREFLIVFYGNEISIAFILASWLLWGAFGSWFLGQFTDKIKFKIGLFSSCQFLLAIFLPLSILAIRAIKTTLDLNPGELIGFFAIAVSSLIILAPICTLLGLIFALSCRIYENKTTILAARTGIIYILEASGAILGGLFISLILIRILSSFHIMIVLSLLNILCAILLLRKVSVPRLLRPACGGARNDTMVFILSILFIGIIYFWSTGCWNKINTHSLRAQWSGYNLLTSKNSLYGNIAVTQKGNQVSLFNNGLRLYSIPDEAASEEAVHFNLLEHPNPNAILLIGGGSGGLIKEILKYPVKKVDYLELDPEIIKISQQYSPSDELKDTKVNVINIEGRRFIKNTPHKYDCVIIHLGDPYTAVMNRYYTVEFFKEVKTILNPKGILSFSLSSSESYINPELKVFLSSIYSSLKKVFPDVKIIPGDTAYFLACTDKNILTYDYKILEQRIKERDLEIKYVREYYLSSRLSPEKIDFTAGALQNTKNVRLNYDFQPISYYYNLILWASRFKDSLLKKILIRVDPVKIWWVFAFFCVAIFIFARKSRNNGKILLAVFCTGFSAMMLQIIILLSFQIIHGYIFAKIGLILNAFMLGLVLGSLWIVKIISKIKNSLRLFIFLQLVIGVYSLILPLILPLNTDIFFLLLSIIAGFMTGAQFPLANKIYLGTKEEIGRVSGLTYGIDLLGGCCAALLAGILLIPILGISATCLLIALFNLLIFFILTA